MMGKTHRAGAVLLAFPILLPVFNLTGTSPTDAAAVSLFLGGSLLTSRLPDIDIPNSGIARKLWLVSWIFSVLHAFFQFLYVLTMRKFKWLKRITRASGHRGITHSLFFWILFGLMLTGIYTLVETLLPLSEFLLQKLLIFFIGLEFGYLSHLLLDYFSGSLRLLEPFSNKKYGRRIIPTNSTKEKFLRTLFLIADIFLLFKTYTFLFPSILSYIESFSIQLTP